MPGFEETETEIRYRVHDPERYDDYGSKDLGDGVRLLMGRKKGTREWEVQSIRFDKEKFDMADAKKWVEEHPDLMERMEKHTQKYAPSQTLYRWKIDAPIMKVVGTEDSEHFYIYGDASVVMIDKEQDKITEKALEHGLPPLLRRARLSLVHSDIIVGEILRSLSWKGHTYRTTVANGALTMIGDVWDDTRMSRETRKGILGGKYRSLSISGEAIETKTICDGTGCFNEIGAIELSAIAICEEGMNQGAKFTLLKAEDPLREEQDAAISEDIRGGMNMEKTKKEAEADPAEKGPDDEKTTPEASSEQEQKQEDEEPEVESEESIQESLKSIMTSMKGLEQAVSGLSARVDRIEQEKAAQETEEEEPEEEEEEVAASADSGASEPEEKDGPENANPDAQKDSKKSKAQDSGGSQFKPGGGSSAKPAWERIGEQVHKAGGLDKPDSPLAKLKKR